MQLTITKGFRRKITAQPTKQNGDPAQLDGALEGEVIGIGDADLTVTQVEGDDKSVYVNATGDLGSNRIRLFADARLGAERREISVEFDVEVIDQEASNLGLSVGEEELIPAT